MAVKTLLSLLVLLPVYCLADTISLGAVKYDVSQLRVDNPRVDVTELPEYAAVFFNFSLYHHDGSRRRPLTGIQKGDLSLRLADENRLMDPTESSFDVVMIEGRLESVPLAWRSQRQVSIRPTLLRFVTLLLDMSQSIFQTPGRLTLVRNTITALVDRLAAATLPGVVVGVYAFADLESLQVVCDYTPDIAKVKLAIEQEFSISDSQRVNKYGVSTNLYATVLNLLEIAEATLKASPARSSLANVFIFTDGHDETRLLSTDAFNLRLSRSYQSWVQGGLDIVTQAVLLNGADNAHPIRKVQFNGELIDGLSPTVAAKSFEKIVADIAQNTPASYSVLVCEAVREGAPRQRRDVLLQGHRVLAYDFSPAGFRRQGAAKCNASALLAQLTNPQLSVEAGDASLRGEDL
jgi:hypothetical protein